MSRVVDLIVLHCSASPNGRGDDIHDIDDWHHQRGFLRSDAWRRQWQPDLCSVGYHYVITASGEVQYGRHHDEVGAHAQGYNAHSIGVCMVGTDEFSEAQWNALTDLVSALRHQYPDANVLGHRDLPNVHKSCPGFDVAGWLETWQ